MKKVLIIGVVVLAISASVFYFSQLKNSVDTTYQAPTEQEVKKAPFGDEKKLEAIRTRENIKRQQELIVQETYLVEEKSRVEQEKKDAIAKFDADIADVELKLETVRGEKISFQ